MTEAERLKTEGNEKFKAGQYAEAIEAYTLSLAEDPTQHLCFSNRSAAYLKLGSSAAKALADAQRCVELAPQFAKGYSRQAAALQDLERWEDAAKVCETGMKVTGDEALGKTRIEVRCRHFQDKMQGLWHGTVSEALGGYDQEMEFFTGGKVRVDALGRSIMGWYHLDCEQHPHHLSIQVPMPDAPPGSPAPPPVPYIVKHDEQGLHLCCPFMVMERPTSFTGPGFCRMERGPAGISGDAEKIARLSEGEKLVACAKELIEALPDAKLEEPQPTDSEDAIREKLMLQVRFESRMYAVQKAFGEDLMKAVLASVRGESPGDVPASLAGTAELKQLTAKMDKCGLLEALGGPPPAPAQASRPTPPKPSPPPAEKPKSATERPPAERQAPGTPAQKDDGGLATVIAAGAVVAAIAVVAGVLIHQRRRAAK